MSTSTSLSVSDNVDMSRPNLFIKETIDSLVQWAKTQPAMVHMLDIQHFPLFFAIVDMRSDQTFDVHQRRESGTIIERPINVDLIRDLGYQWHLEDTNDASHLYTHNDFTRLHRTICEKIDEAISVHHGIICTTMITNNIGDPSNAFILHFGDLLITRVREVEHDGGKPHVYIQNTSFAEVPDNVVDSLFLPLMGSDYNLKQKEILFLMMNADLYFHIYCYWHNESNKPIRCQGTGLRALSRSLNIIENVYFQGHQIAKMGELTRKCQGERSKRLYLVD